MINLYFDSLSDEDVDFIIESIDDTIGFIKPGTKINGMDVVASFQSARRMLVSHGAHFENPEISAILSALQFKQQSLLQFPSKVLFKDPDKILSRCNRLVAQFESIKHPR